MKGDLTGEINELKPLAASVRKIEGTIYNPIVNTILAAVGVRLIFYPYIDQVVKAYIDKMT